MCAPVSESSNACGVLLPSGSFTCSWMVTNPVESDALR